ncbi:MAG: hypothetical protein H5T50_10105 [Nitrososphaeria archaeon]|nr:hypothetical protein [Nitrososphaeria archaeon]
MAYKLPLAKILKGKMLKIAELQDLIVIELCKRFDFILRGETAIWRIYGAKDSLTTLTSTTMIMWK